MKKLILVAVLMMSSASFAHSVAERMVATLKTDAVMNTINNIVNSSTDTDMRYFNGIVMSDIQTGCMGDRVYLNLVFDRLMTKPRGGFEIKKCHVMVTFGECGVASGKINTIDDELNCDIGL